MAKKKTQPTEKSTIQVVVSLKERSEIERAADKDGKTLSAYCAEMILGRPSSLPSRGRPKSESTS